MLSRYFGNSLPSKQATVYDWFGHHEHQTLVEHLYTRYRTVALGNGIYGLAVDSA